MNQHVLMRKIAELLNIRHPVISNFLRNIKGIK